MSNNLSNPLREVYIVDGSRTPFLKVRDRQNPFSAADLAVATSKELLLRQPTSPEKMDEVISGCILPSPQEANIARIIALRLGCGNDVPAWTVQRNCASAMQALDSAAKDIAIGRSDLVLAGGTEAMSHAPLLIKPEMTDWLMRFGSAKGFSSKLKVMTQFHLRYFGYVIALLKGLTDPVVGLSMGQTAENLAYRFHITRGEMDQFALQSHQRLTRALESGYMAEITPLYDDQGNVYTEDDGLRKDTSLEKLAKLKPFFDKKYGNVTAGNSSQVTDGACFLILASKEAVQRYQLKVRAKIIDTEWAAVDPAEMGLGPAHAVPPLLNRNHLTFSDIDYWEINEAFAAQVLAVLKAWRDEKYCQQELGLDHAFGEMDMNKLNVDGGAVAIGHPIGTSGARIVLHLLHVLERFNAHRGVATLCVGGGQGGAMLIERVEGIQ